MGGGKGSIDHYVTPIKAGRVIVEIGGHCEFFEVFFDNIYFIIFNNINSFSNFKNNLHFIMVK